MIVIAGTQEFQLGNNSSLWSLQKKKYVLQHLQIFLFLDKNFSFEAFAMCRHSSRISGNTAGQVEHSDCVPRSSCSKLVLSWRVWVRSQRTTQLLSAWKRPNTFRKLWTDLPHHACAFNSGCTHSVSQIFQEVSDLLRQLCIFFPCAHGRFALFLMHNDYTLYSRSDMMFARCWVAAQVLHSICVCISGWTYYLNPMCLLVSSNTCNHKWLLWQNTGHWIVTAWMGTEMRESRNTSG